MSRLCTLVPSMARLVVSCLAGALLVCATEAAPSCTTTLPRAPSRGGWTKTIARTARMMASKPGSPDEDPWRFHRPAPPLAPAPATTRGPAPRHHAALRRFVARRLGRREIEQPSCTNGYTWLVLDNGRIIELADPGLAHPARAGTVPHPHGQLGLLWHRGDDERAGPGSRGATRLDHDPLRRAPSVSRLDEQLRTVTAARAASSATTGKRSERRRTPTGANSGAQSAARSIPPAGAPTVARSSISPRSRDASRLLADVRAR